MTALFFVYILYASIEKVNPICIKKQADEHIFLLYADRTYLWQYPLYVSSVIKSVSALSHHKKCNEFLLNHHTFYNE